MHGVALEMRQLFNIMEISIHTLSQENDNGLFKVGDKVWILPKLDFDPDPELEKHTQLFIEKFMILDMYVL